MLFRSDIAILRNGKAKKTDPPIPADLAPISGAGKRVRKEKPAEAPAFLDPIKFRYREDAVVEDRPAPAAESSEETKASRNRNRRRKPRPEAQDSQPPKAAEKPARQEKPVEKAHKADPPAADSPAETGEPKKSNHRHRPHYRRRKPKAPGADQ